MQTLPANMEHRHSSTVRATCPDCASPNTRPSRRFKWRDLWRRIRAEQPWRCRNCNARFYAAISKTQTSRSPEKRRSRHWRKPKLRISQRTQIQLLVLAAVLAIFYMFLKFITEERAPATEGRLGPGPARHAAARSWSTSYSRRPLASDRANTLSVHAASAGRENGKSTNAWQNTAGTPAAHGKRQLWRRHPANSRNTPA